MMGFEVEGWLRIPLGPGQGGRNIDLNRLHDVAATDQGWAALCRLMGADWTDPVVTPDMLHPTTLKEMRNELDVARTEASRYHIELEASQAQVRDLADLLDQARTERDQAIGRGLGALTERDQARAERGVLRIELGQVKADLTEYQEMAAAEANYRDAQIHELRRSRNKWRRRARKSQKARAVATGSLIAADDRVGALRASNATLQTRLAAAQPVLDAARAWYDIDPLPACPIPQEEALVRAVRAWLTPNNNPEPDEGNEADIAHMTAAGTVFPPPAPICGLTEDWNGYLRVPIGPCILPHDHAGDWHEDEQGCRWKPGHSGIISHDLGSGQLRARSCPSCHSIGDPRDNCRDPWHPENVRCSQCGQPWTDPACGPTHAALAAERAAGSRNATTGFPLLPIQPIPTPVAKRRVNYPTAEPDEPTLRRDPWGNLYVPLHPTAPDLADKQLAEFVAGMNRTLAQTGGGGQIVVHTYPTITSPGDADAYLAGLLNPEAPTPIPVNRADPDTAADDDWTPPTPDPTTQAIQHAYTQSGHETGCDVPADTPRQPEPIRDVHTILDDLGIPGDASAADRLRTLIQEEAEQQNQLTQTIHDMTGQQTRLAHAIIRIAQTAGMADSYWHTDRLVRLALDVLGWTPEQARDHDYSDEDTDA